MHELSIANSVIDVVTEHLIESGSAGASRVVVEVGELSGVVPAALRTAFAAAIQSEAGLRNATLEIRPIAVALYCESCNRQQPAVGPANLRCRTCNTPSANVIKGRELEVVQIEVF